MNVSARRKRRLCGRSFGHQFSVWRELVLVGGAVGLYEAAHLLNSDRRAAAFDHAQSVLQFERALRIDLEQAVQKRFLRNDTMRSLANGVYAWLYWPVLLGSVVSLWRHDRARYHILRNAMLLSGLAGLGVFLWYPTAPPRMLPGFVDTIQPGTVAHAIVHGSMADPYAALPSFHVGWFTLAAVTLAASKQHPLALPIAVSGAAAMGTAVVATANHYIVDVASGLALCLAASALATRLAGPGAGAGA